MVSIYWTLAFINKLDKLATKLGLRRNEFIKAAVNEKIKREQRAKLG